MSPDLHRICIYAGSSFGAAPEYSEAAAALGAACARRKIGVVYGGGSVGLMGILANAALAAGGEVIGVIPRVMLEQERGHRALTQLIPVESMHERKHCMAQLADAFIALPGGIGTLEELVEVYTWLQLGLHLKPVGLLNVHHFYDPLIALLDHMCEAQFLTAPHREMLTVEEEPERLLDRLATTTHTAIVKPIHRTDGTG